ncbi:unnamed protein product [Penicillium discolor]
MVVQISDPIFEAMKDRVVFISGKHISHPIINTESTINKPEWFLGNRKSNDGVMSQARRECDDRRHEPTTVRPRNLGKAQTCPHRENQRDAFIQAEEWFGHLDHVFANAGMGPTIDFLDDTLDKKGHLTPPDLKADAISLVGAIPLPPA